MKTIELKDEECWWIDIAENTEKVKYVISENIYEKLEMIMINSSCFVDFSIFEGLNLNAPNLVIISFDAGSQFSIPVFDGIKFNTPKLKMINLRGVGSLKWFKGFQENIHNLLLKELALNNTGITQIPEFILRMKTLHGLTFRNEQISELPEGLFALENLVRLNFQYCTSIITIPDCIKKLVNLEYIDLWAATLQYLSPELFLLPKLYSVNFAYTQYSPTKELLEAYEIYKGKNTIHHNSMPWEKI